MEAKSDGGLFTAALGNISVMETLLSAEGEGRPTGVSAVPPALHYEADCDTGLTDAAAFTAGMARFTEETTQLAKLNELLDEGQGYATTLYTWRSCSLAIPVIRSHNQENRLEIYEKTLEVLEPEVNKLRRMMDFKRRAVHQFTSEVERLCRDRSVFVSETYLFTLGKVINMFAHLDELKNMKASMKNDYATYKRAAEILKRFSEPRLMEESQQLSMFLATHNVLLMTVKDSVQRLASYEELLADVIAVSVRFFENRLYMTPAEKHGAVKVMGFCLFLIDGPTVNINKMEGRKKVNIAKIDRIFKQMEVVPLLGDMVTSPFRYVEKTPNYDASRWPLCAAPTAAQAATQTHLERQLPALRAAHSQLIGQLTLLGAARKRVNEATKAKPVQKSREDEDAEAEQLYHLALVTLHRLSSYTASITEMVSWKLLNPTDRRRNPECPEDAEEFEKATRYNYTSGEKGAIVETLAMIRGIVAILQRMEAELHSAIYRHVYTTLQRFVQCELREPLRKATKHRKDAIAGLLTRVRDVGTDLAAGVDPRSDPLLQGKKDVASGFIIQVARKQVVAASTQLYLMRTMLEALVVKNGNKKSLRNDLDSVHIEAIERFLQTTFFWPYLIHFSKSIEQCSDLSQLWYREFYLEMTMGKRVQFPIDMSLPWILTNYILETRDPTVMESCLYPLDLYNDAAQCALNYFSKQFLYDEIEAEVNLCFDQLVYKLSEQIFEHYKCLASSIYLNLGMQNACKKCGVNLPRIPEARYEALLQRHHLQLLGYDIDLKRRLTQSVEAAILKSLDVALSRFEASDITAIVELEALIAVNRLTHRLLQRHLAVRDFDALFGEANHSVTAPYGRVTLYLFTEINYNLLPQYCYNMATDRFVKTIFPFVDPVERDKLPAAAHYHLWGNKLLSTCYTAVFSLYTNFVGRPHFEAMARLLNYLDIAVIFNELLMVIKHMLSGILVPYLKTLKAVMPKRCIMPRYEYGSAGGLSYYQAQLNDVMMYSDLQPKVFQCMREIGNAILFFRLLEQVLSQKEVTELCHSAMFLNIIPKPHIPLKVGTETESRLATAAEDGGKKPTEEREKQLQEMMKKLRHKYRNQHLVSAVSKLGTPQQVSYVQDACLLTRERLCFELSLFKMVLRRVATFLDDDIWTGGAALTHGLDSEAEPQFHRLWSSLQFVFCIPSRANEYTVEQLFGEGLNWAACTLIRLLQQQRCFEVTDFCYHLQKMQKIDMKTDDVSGVSLRKMVERIRKFQILNDQIFSVINVHLNSRDEEVIAIRHLAPPTAENTKLRGSTLAETDA